MDPDEGARVCADRVLEDLLVPRTSGGRNSVGLDAHDGDLRQEIVSPGPVSDQKISSWPLLRRHACLNHFGSRACILYPWFAAATSLIPGSNHQGRRLQATPSQAVYSFTSGLPSGNSGLVGRRVLRLSDRNW